MLIKDVKQHLLCKRSQSKGSCRDGFVLDHPRDTNPVPLHSKASSQVSIFSRRLIASTVKAEFDSFARGLDSFN